MTDNHPVPPNPRCAVVLMSTYQGERYVVEQLESILQQLPIGARIFVRDDGSTDGTVAAIESLQDSRISLIRGANIGFSRSFLTVLSQVPADADLVMFSDQDDVWLPGKIDRAWVHLAPMGDRPALYGSAQMLAGAELQPLHRTKVWSYAPSFCGALVENKITGCTAALNAAAVRLVRQAGPAPEVYFHDWWLYLVVSAFGRVIFDPEPTLLYRQHSSNQIGYGSGLIGRSWYQIRFILRKDWIGILLAQIHALWKYYGPQLPPEVAHIIASRFVLTDEGAVPRWSMVFSPRRWRDSLAEELPFRLLLAMHKIYVWPPRARRLASPPDPLSSAVELDS